MGFDPWVGKILWRRAWRPTPVFLPEESRGERSLAGYSPWGRKESDTTEELTLHYPSKQHWFCKALIFLCLLGPPGSGGWHGIRRDAVYLLLMKNKQGRLLDWVGRAFRLWCRPDTCEREEGEERKFGRRASQKDADLTNPGTSHWGA